MIKTLFATAIIAITANQQAMAKEVPFNGFPIILRPGEITVIPLPEEIIMEIRAGEELIFSCTKSQAKSALEMAELCEPGIIECPFIALAEYCYMNGELYDD